MEYKTPIAEETKDSEVSYKIVDICFSPGEDVFLAHRADGTLYLFGQEDP